MQAPTMSYCQSENSVLSQRTPNDIKAACTEVICCSRTATVPAWGQMRHTALVPLLLSLLILCGDMKSQQCRSVKEDKYSPQQKAGVGGM